MRTILFVCTGNTCRSPMAEGIARQQIESGQFGPQPDVFIASAGVQATDGARPTRETVQSLKARGISYEGKSKRVTPEMIRKADLVLCMTEGHERAVREMITDTPEDTVEISMLDPGGDIEDPLGTGQEAYDALATQMDKLIDARLKKWLIHEDRVRR